MKNFSQLYALLGWDGVNNRIYKTSSKGLKNWAHKGIDSVLNCTAVKIFYAYDLNGFISTAKNGLSFIYQTHYFTVTLKMVNGKKVYSLKGYNTVTYEPFDIPSLTLTRMHMLTATGHNKDITDVLNSFITTGIVND